jgi:glycerol-3-phosphate dehydrogenase (NAD(P)+)
MAAKVTVLGGGAMGTGCSIVLAESANRSISLWMRNREFADETARLRENRRLLPGVPLPDSIAVTADLAAALADTQLLVVAVPTAYLRGALGPVAPLLAPDCPVVSVVKGIENGTFLRPSEIIRQVLGERPVAALCGPSHAEEFARRLPCSVVVAATEKPLALTVQELFNTDRFRVYTNPDLAGVELAGALKNIIAIAAGICDGLNYGDNAKAALLTRGIVEITRFGAALGAQADTFAGLAGIGQGAPLEVILKELHGVAEGVTTCRSVYDMSQARGIDMPITTEVYRVLFEHKPAAAATGSLMMRPLRSETPLG